MIIMYAFFQTIALKVRHVAPPGHIIPTLNQPICLCPFSLMMLAELSGEEGNTNLIVFGLTRLGSKPRSTSDEKES
jgi:hypothetical protein